MAEMSPGPVLQALRATARSRWNTDNGDAEMRFVREIDGKCSIGVAIDDSVGVIDLALDTHPVALAAAPTIVHWVELEAVTYGAKPERLGLLIEPTREFSRGWPRPLVSVRCARMTGRLAAVAPGRIMVDVEAYSLSKQSFADHERARRGLLTARDASEAELEKMNAFTVSVGEFYLRSIPNDSAPAWRRLTPPYWQGVELGVSELRSALAATCIRDWTPSVRRLTPEASALAKCLFVWLTDCGPFLALYALKALSGPHFDLRAIDLADANSVRATEH